MILTVAESTAPDNNRDTPLHRGGHANPVGLAAIGQAAGLSGLGEQPYSPLAFRSLWPQIGIGRLAVDEPLANRVRSGRKQP